MKKKDATKSNPLDCDALEAQKIKSKAKDLYLFFQNNEFVFQDSSSSKLLDFHYSESKTLKVYIALACQSENNLSVLDISSVDEDDIPQLFKTAHENIERLDVNFVFLEGFENKVLIAEQGLLNGEAILSAKQMIKAQTLLKAASIYVAIARRGTILICADHASDKEKRDFMDMHYRLWMYEESLNQRICDDVFIVKDGSIDEVVYLSLKAQ